MTPVEALLAIVTIAAAAISGLADLDGAWERCVSIRKAYKKTLRSSQDVNFAAGRNGWRHQKKACEVSKKATWTATSAVKKNSAGFGFSELLATSAAPPRQTIGRGASAARLARSAQA
ncbi:hypothetical protein [Caulobacter soli]|uniref:hypothetical protein n=1 Tax=Caulobacter soli TaxID=2708539 RepID=UPI0013ED9E5C|nr:hypothetical protein [Caulobacter soli]